MTKMLEQNKHKIIAMANPYFRCINAIEPKQPNNKYEARPYFGPIIEYNNMDIYVPLTTNKKNITSDEYIPITSKEGEIIAGIICGFALPIRKDQIVEYDLTNTNKHFDLINEEIEFFNNTSNIEMIIQKVKKVIDSNSLRFEMFKSYYHNFDSIIWQNMDKMMTKNENEINSLKHKNESQYNMILNLSSENNKLRSKVKAKNENNEQNNQNLIANNPFELLNLILDGENNSPNKGTERPPKQEPESTIIQETTQNPEMSQENLTDSDSIAELNTQPVNNMVHNSEMSQENLMDSDPITESNTQTDNNMVHNSVIKHTPVLSQNNSLDPKFIPTENTVYNNLLDTVRKITDIETLITELINDAQKKQKFFIDFGYNEKDEDLKPIALAISNSGFKIATEYVKQLNALMSLNCIDKKQILADIMKKHQTQNKKIELYFKVRKKIKNGEYDAIENKNFHDKIEQINKLTNICKVLSQKYTDKNIESSKEKKEHSKVFERIEVVKKLIFDFYDQKIYSNMSEKINTHIKENIIKPLTKSFIEQKETLAEEYLKYILNTNELDNKLIDNEQLQNDKPTINNSTLANNTQPGMRRH